MENQQQNNSSEEITLEKLASIINEGFNNNNARFDASIEQLRNEMNSHVSNLDSSIKEIKLDTEHIRAELNKKTDKVDHNTLIYRVEKLEKLAKKYA